MRCEDVAAFPGYRVREDGTVESRWEIVNDGRGFQSVLTDEWRPLKPLPGKKGYLYVYLYRDGKQFRRSIHGLVLTAFAGPRPAGAVARHFPDRNPANNHADNLRWGTYAENEADKVEQGTATRGSRIAQAKLTEEDIPKIRELLAKGTPQREVARSFGVSQRTVSRVNTGERWGHVWGTKEEARQRREAHAGHTRGSRDGNAKLTEADIPEIRRLAAEAVPTKEIANRFSVSPTTVRNVVHGRFWRHVSS